MTLGTRNSCVQTSFLQLLCDSADEAVHLDPERSWKDMNVVCTWLYTYNHVHSYMYIIPMYCTDFIVITRHNFEDFGLVNVFMSADDQLIHKLLKLGLQNIRSPGSHEIWYQGTNNSIKVGTCVKPNKVSSFKRPLSHPFERISFWCHWKLHSFFGSPRKHRTKPIIVYSALAGPGRCQWWVTWRLGGLGGLGLALLQVRWQLPSRAAGPFADGFFVQGIKPSRWSGWEDFVSRRNIRNQRPQQAVL